MLSDSIKLINNSISNAHPNPNLTGVIRPIPKKNWPLAPTHYKVNDFQYAFQEFVNTYGMPRYKEINPALFTAASFPFLFGVMYGDIGHGSCLMLAGLYLIMTYKSFNLDRDNKLSRINGGNMLAEIYTARYMLFAMGIMAMYAGFIYNDYFSLGLNMFGSNYTFESHEIGDKATPNYDYGEQQGVYPIGVDPIWKISGNELLFYNSMKMKTSVIIGILQMTLGSKTNLFCICL
jgi:V-type H+-transporting ATPase subunit a